MRRLSSVEEISIVGTGSLRMFFPSSPKDEMMESICSEPSGRVAPINWHRLRISSGLFQLCRSWIVSVPEMKYRLCDGPYISFKSRSVSTV